jgi:hypothetical protein
MLASLAKTADSGRFQEVCANTLRVVIIAGDDVTGLRPPPTSFGARFLPNLPIVNSKLPFETALTGNHNANFAGFGNDREILTFHPKKLDFRFNTANISHASGITGFLATSS